MATFSSRFLALVSLLALVALSVPGRAGEAAVLQLLKQPGVHAIMRHALAPGTGDPQNFKLNDCSTQRNLDERGRAQARAIGNAFKAAGIVFDQVLTSQWCRCRETAELLGLGATEDFPGLNSFFQDRSTAARQTAQVAGHLASLPAGQTVLLVTHQVNITGLTGRWVRSGEVFLIKAGADGKAQVIGEFLLPPG